MDQLTSHQDAKIKAIGKAIQETAADRLSAKEREAIASIEQRRASLHHSNECISVIDYGAGTPDSERTQQEMDDGVRYTARLGERSVLSITDRYDSTRIQSSRRNIRFHCSRSLLR